MLFSFARRNSIGLKVLCFGLCALHPLAAQTSTSNPTQPLRGVLPGVDVLRLNNFDVLRGRRVGLVTNQTGITRDGTSTIDLLFGARNMKLVALFGPEHGLRGTVVAGQSVRGGRDARTGLSIYSLYGASKRPSSAMLRGVDTIVFDMQEIGSRSYTYIATLGEVMAACARFKKPLVVLDRPNPIGGNRVEGNLVESRFRSFVSPFAIPYCHGLTIGELAQLLNGRGLLPGRARCTLRVVPMLGYRRDMTWAQTGLRWVKPSPNVPYPETSWGYAATGIVGELSALSIGIGTDVPFAVAGAPGLNATALVGELTRRRLRGWEFRAVQWTPSRGAYSGRVCQGVQVVLRDFQGAEMSRLNFEIMDATRKIAPRTQFFRTRAQSQMFDKVCGTDRVRRMFQSGAGASQIWAQWNAPAARFRVLRQPYLLYR